MAGCGRERDRTGPAVPEPVAGWAGNSLFLQPPLPGQLKATDQGAAFLLQLRPHDLRHFQQGDVEVN